MISICFAVSYAPAYYLEEHGPHWFRRLVRQHQGLEYTSVEAFENLMRATVIAFMARSASAGGESDMQIIMNDCVFVCFCWVSSPSRTSVKWDLEMVHVWGMAHPAGRNPELEKLEYALSCKGGQLGMDGSEGRMRFSLQLIVCCGLSTSKDPSYHLISRKHFQARVCKNTILVGIGPLHKGACHGVGSKP